MMILKELVKGISFEGHLDDREINSITYDSRKVKPGSLFVAISGMQEDGHSYIPEAHSPWSFPARRFPLAFEFPVEDIVI